MNLESNIPYVFFGTPDFSVQVLNQLEAADLLPPLAVTAPDRQRGRGQKLKPTAVKAWAQEHSIEVLTPKIIDDDFIATLKNKAPSGGWPVFVVVAYGKILPAELIYLPEHNTLNLHPSLLPNVRGAAPIRGTILQEDEAGVTVIELDEKMDHGPIVAQEIVETDQWPPYYNHLKNQLADAGGTLLAQTLPDWVNNDTEARPQNHDKATYIGKFSSEDGKIDFHDNPEKNLRKIRAFTDWPKAHFFTSSTNSGQADDGTRVIITKAHRENGELVLDRVKPAGQQEMDYSEFKRQG